MPAATRSTATDSPMCRNALRARANARPSFAWPITGPSDQINAGHRIANAYPMPWSCIVHVEVVA